MKFLFWSPDPLNKGKLKFYCIFELSEAYTTRIPQKTVQKPLKTTENAVAGTNILPQNPKSADTSPPCTLGSRGRVHQT